MAWMYLRAFRFKLFCSLVVVLFYKRFCSLIVSCPNVNNTNHAAKSPNTPVKNSALRGGTQHAAIVQRFWTGGDGCYIQSKLQVKKSLAKENVIKHDLSFLADGFLSQLKKPRLKV